MCVRESHIAEVGGTQSKLARGLFIVRDSINIVIFAGYRDILFTLSPVGDTGCRAPATARRYFNY